MRFEFLGGAREIGRSAVLIDDTLLLDYGMDTGTPPAFPVGDPDPEAVVVSHGHLDHAGAVPSLLSGDSRPEIHWTPPTEDLCRVLARDTLKLHGGGYACPFTEAELARLPQHSTAHGYGEPFEAAGYEVTLYDAGHIPGSAHVLVTDGDTRLLYTGDFHTEDRRGDDAASGHANGRDAPASGQRLVAGTTARPDADIVICESTYAETTRPPRAEIEREFVERVERTLWDGGTAVVPAFAIGRTQEMFSILADAGVECYVDGMGTRVTDLFARPRNREFLRDPEAFRRAKGHARFVSGRDGQRKRIADSNTAVVTTSGMLQGGPAMTYVPAVRANPTNLIALTGYQVEGTPGRDLLERGSAEIDGRRMPVSARVEAYDFSAHADRDGLMEFLEPYRDATVLAVHGDRCPAFAAELRADGVDARAPELGARIVVG